MNLYKLYLFFIALILTSCEGKFKKCNNLNVNNTINYKSQQIVNQALINGDTSAYYLLSCAYYDSPNSDFLYTALLMANKNQYNLAYLDVYYCLTSSFGKKEFTELDNLDSKTRSLAIQYLIEGAEKGNNECKRILGQCYIEGKFLKKDIIKGNKLKLDGEN